MCVVFIRIFSFVRPCVALPQERCWGKRTCYQHPAASWQDSKFAFPGQHGAGSLL